MGITATAKAKISIGSKTYPTGSNPALVVADYNPTGESYTAIGNVSDLGDFGDEANEIKFESISDSRVLKVKGTRDAGDLSLVVGRDASDAGQTAMRAAIKADLNYNFKIVMNDPPATQTGAGTTFYFRGLVQSATNKFGGPNNVVMQTFKISINSDILEVAPT